MKNSLLKVSRDSFEFDLEPIYKFVIFVTVVELLPLSTFSLRLSVHTFALIAIATIAAARGDIYRSGIRKRANEFRACQKRTSRRATPVSRHGPSKWTTSSGADKRTEKREMTARIDLLIAAE